MKKQLLVTILVLAPVMGFAKVADFNALITENAQDQKQLHSEVKNNFQDLRGAVAPKEIRQRVVVVDEDTTTYNAPTREEHLKFKKEKYSHRHSEAKEFERLASEISAAEY